MSNLYADEEVGHGLLSESATARYELDSSRSLSAEPRGVKRTVGLVLESPCFWVFVVMLIMLDLAMFAWQVRREATAHPSLLRPRPSRLPPWPPGRRAARRSPSSRSVPTRPAQVIYDDDSRLHIYEFLIACFFIVELFLRVFAFETKHLFKSWSVSTSLADQHAAARSDRPPNLRTSRGRRQRPRQRQRQRYHDHTLPQCAAFRLVHRDRGVQPVRVRDQHADPGRALGEDTAVVTGRLAGGEGRDADEAECIARGARAEGRRRDAGLVAPAQGRRGQEA